MLIILDFIKKKTYIDNSFHISHLTFSKYNYHIRYIMKVQIYDDKNISMVQIHGIEHFMELRVSNVILSRNKIEISDIRRI